MSLTTFTTFFYFFDKNIISLYVADMVAIVLAAIAFFFAYRGVNQCINSEVRLENKTYMKIYASLITFL